MKVLCADPSFSTLHNADTQDSLILSSIVRSLLTLPLIVALILTALLATTAGEAAAATKKAKKPKKPKVTPITISVNDFVAVTVKIANGTNKKKKPYVVACYQSKPGTIRANGDRYLFSPYKEIIALAKWKADKTRSARDRTTLELKKKLSSAAKCGKVTPPVNSPDPGNPDDLPQPGDPTTPIGPGPDPDPDHLSLRPYTGTFGAAEAQALFDRFAWGASPRRIQQAINEGLGATVNDLLTIKDDSSADLLLEDYACDGRRNPDPNNKTCNPINPNDFSPDGLRYGIYAKIVEGNNPYFMRMYFFLMDKWMAGVTRLATGCYLHAIREHHDLLLRNAFSGDFVQFTREYTDDLLGALIALNRRFSTKYSPNEDWAREIMERGTIGKANLDGVPNYTDADVAELARVYTGWKIVEHTVTGQNVCFGAWTRDLHDTTPKRIFRGTPYEATVFNSEDVLKVLFNRPEVAERMAHQIWTDFINEAPDNAALRRLAAIIRANNYNIHAVMKTIMLSKAVYATASQKTLIKHPLELVLGFLRKTEIPYNYSSVALLMNNLSQRPLDPPTVFGWDTKTLADELSTLRWVNGVNGPVFQNMDTLEKDTGFNWAVHFFSNIEPNKSHSEQVTKSFANLLGLSLNQTQLNGAIQFLDYEVTTCPNNNTFVCSNDPSPGRYRRRNVFDANKLADSSNRGKSQALLAAMAASSEFRMK